MDIFPSPYSFLQSFWHGTLMVHSASLCCPWIPVNPTEPFRGVSCKDSGWSLQPLLHPFRVLAALAKLCQALGSTEEAPNRAIFPKRAGWAARSPRQVQTTPAKGRQGAEGTDPHPQAGRGGNGTWAMSEGPQPTATTGKDSHITHGAFTAILPHSQDVIHTLPIIFFPPIFQ